MVGVSPLSHSEAFDKIGFNPILVFLMNHVRHLIYTLCLTGLVLACPVFGSTAPQQVVVDTLLQDDHETSLQFFHRVTQTLRGLTQTTGHEYGGQLCSAPHGRLGMFVSTSNQRMYVHPVYGCPLQTPNMLGYIIHSHPEPGLSISFVINDKDKDKPFKKQFNYMSAKGQRRFSNSDYKLGPGYIVAGRYLIYQQGHGTECVVLDLDIPTRLPTRLSKTGKILEGQTCSVPPPHF